MGAIEEFIENFPYAERYVFESLAEEIKVREPDLSFLSNLIRNIVEKRYADDPVALLRGVTQIIIPEDDERRKALALFVATHPILGLMIVPVVLSDIGAEWSDYLGIAKHIYLSLRDVYCWAVEKISSLSDNFQRQKKETLKLFAMAVGKLADDIATLAHSEDMFDEALELFKCAEKAAESSGDEASMVRIVKGLAFLNYLFGRANEALDLYKRLLNLPMSKGEEMRVKLRVAELLIETGGAREAIPMLEGLLREVDRLRRMGFASSSDRALVLLYLGKALRVTGNLKRARKLLEEAYDISRKTGGYLKEKIVGELAEVYVALGDEKKLRKIRSQSER